MSEEMIMIPVPKSALRRDNVQYEPTGEFKKPTSNEPYWWGNSVCLTSNSLAVPVPILRPVWQPPEFAATIGGWMYHNRYALLIGFSTTKPVFDQGVCLYATNAKQMSLALAKAIGLYPPHWDGLPAEQRILYLGPVPEVTE